MGDGITQNPSSRGINNLRRGIYRRTPPPRLSAPPLPSPSATVLSRVRRRASAARAAPFDLLYIEPISLNIPPDLPVAPFNSKSLRTTDSACSPSTEFSRGEVFTLRHLRAESNPARSRAISFSLGRPLIFTKYVFGTCTRLHQKLRQRAIIRQQQQSFAPIVEPPPGTRAHIFRK